MDENFFKKLIRSLLTKSQAAGGEFMVTPKVKKSQSRFTGTGF
jgi:hypothetical protein